MVRNSKLSGTLLVLAFLACVFMGSSAENTHDQALNATASEGGLEESLNDVSNILKKKKIIAFELGSMRNFKRPNCAYFFRGKNGRPCLANLSQQVSCHVKIWEVDQEFCPEVKSESVNVIFSENNGKYSLEISSLDIDDFSKSFTTELLIKKSIGTYKEYECFKVQPVTEFNGYEFSTVALA
eukprot:Nk52_evm27s317 gene=Nk52_evmTU27s317